MGVNVRVGLADRYDWQPSLRASGGGAPSAHGGRPRLSRGAETTVRWRGRRAAAHFGRRRPAAGARRTAIADAGRLRLDDRRAAGAWGRACCAADGDRSSRAGKRPGFRRQARGCSPRRAAVAGHPHRSSVRAAVVGWRGHGRSARPCPFAGSFAEARGRSSVRRAVAVRGAVRRFARLQPFDDLPPWSVSPSAPPAANGCFLCGWGLWSAPIAQRNPARKTMVRLGCIRCTNRTIIRQVAMVVRLGHLVGLGWAVRGQRRKR